MRSGAFFSWQKECRDNLVTSLRTHIMSESSCKVSNSRGGREKEMPCPQLENRDFRKKLCLKKNRSTARPTLGNTKNEFLGRRGAKSGPYLRNENIHTLNNMTKAWPSLSRFSSTQSAVLPQHKPPPTSLA